MRNSLVPQVKKTTLACVVALLGLGFADGLKAEQNMDSMDIFNVATSSALARTKDGYFKDAISAEENALKTAENRFGKIHPALAPVLTDLATIQRFMGHYTEAETDLKWCLAIREKSLVPSDPLIAESLDQLACLYNDWGRWQEAAFFEDQAIKIGEEPANQSPALLERGQVHLGEIQLNLKETEKALSHLKKCQGILEKNNQSDPRQWMDLFNLLAKAYLDSRQTSECESYLQRSLELAKKNYQPDSIEVGDATEALANFYQAQGHPEKAHPLYESAFKIYRRFVGVNYTYPSLPYLRRLAQAFQSLGQDKDAEDLLDKTLQSSREVFGTQHPQVAMDLLDLALVERKSGKKEQAQKHLKEALEIATAYFQPNHPLVLKIQAQLGH